MKIENEIRCEVCSKTIGYRLAYGASIRLREHACAPQPIANGTIKIVVDEGVPNGEVHLVTNGRTMAKIINVGDNDGDQVER